MIVYCCCLILTQLPSNVHFQMTVEDFPCRGQPNLNANFLTVTFRGEHLSLMVLPLFRLQCNNFTCPVIHTTLRSPCKTNHGIYTRRRPSGFLTRSSDQSESPQMKQIRRSIFLSSSLLPALCVEMLATPTLPAYAFPPCVRSLHASLLCITIDSFQ